MRFADAIGLGAIVLLWAASIYSLVLNFKQYGLQGPFLGRFLGQVGGGNHTLAIFAVIIPMTAFVLKSHINLLMGFGVILMADFFHEALWNIPYYVYYDMDSRIFIFLSVLIGFLAGAGIWIKREHSFAPLWRLGIWFALITGYLVFTHGGFYSENVLNPSMSYPQNLLVNAYEISEVALFAFLLYKALMVGLLNGKHPLFSRMFPRP